MSRKTPPEFQQMLDSLISKPWQDFFTMLFLVSFVLYALIAGFRNGFLRRDLPPQTQFAYGAIFFLLGVLPVCFFALFQPKMLMDEFWKTLTEPFVSASLPK